MYLLCEDKNGSSYYVLATEHIEVAPSPLNLFHTLAIIKQ